MLPLPQTHVMMIPSRKGGALGCRSNQHLLPPPPICSEMETRLRQPGACVSELSASRGQDPSPSHPPRHPHKPSTTPRHFGGARCSLTARVLPLLLLQQRVVSEMPEARGTHVYVHSHAALAHACRRGPGHTKNTLLRAPLTGGLKELRTVDQKGRKKAGLIYEAFRCLDGSLRTRLGSAAA